MIEEHMASLVAILWMLLCVCLFVCWIVVALLISLLSALGMIVLLWYGVEQGCSKLRRVLSLLKALWLRAWAWVVRGLCIPHLLCFWAPFILGAIVLVCGVCCTPDHEEGRFIPRREEPTCPCCRAVLVHRCIHELGEWRHVFQYECMPVLERLADKLQAIEPPSPQP